jgi:hypothetical protein
MDQVNSAVLADVSSGIYIEGIIFVLSVVFCENDSSIGSPVVRDNLRPSFGTYSDLATLCVSLLCKVGELVTGSAKAGAFVYDDAKMQRLEPSLTMDEGARFAYLSRLERWYFSDFVRLDI